MKNITVIGFDADDTLWHNENLFREVEARIADMLSVYRFPEPIADMIYRKQMANLPQYGYGIKAFTIALLETAIEASSGTISAYDLQAIIDTGKKMLSEPVVLFDGVPQVLQKLAGQYKLVVVTKGDLVDQERKLSISGLSHFFHHMEILSNKDEAAYSALLSHLDIQPENFLMIGNSLRSDVIPVLNLGASAIHIPYRTTWEHEKADPPVSKCYRKVHNISDIPSLLL